MRFPKHLLTLVGLAPKPRKVAEAIAVNKELLQLPNVTVYARRVTPIDKEVQVGRWKVIEEELKKRDLPIVGPGRHDKAREKGWLLGKA